MNWIKIKLEKDLPKEGEYVLARHNRKTWFDVTDQNNVNCVVVKLIKGISLEERELIKNEGSSERWKIYKFGDQEGNNLLPYRWSTFGTTSFFGQEIIEWTPII